MRRIPCARDKRQQEYTREFLKEFGLLTLPRAENIGHRAIVYIGEYSLSHGIRAGDAIIAATVAENNLTLCSGNAKHFRPIRDLKFRAFRP